MAFSAQLPKKIHATHKANAHARFLVASTLAGAEDWLMSGIGDIMNNTAAITGNKKIEMVAVKDLLGLTGYIRGGVSPIGMKKKFPTYVDESALQFQQITVSSGTRGAQLLLDREALLNFVQAKTANLTEKT